MTTTCTITTQPSCCGCRRCARSTRCSPCCGAALRCSSARSYSATARVAGQRQQGCPVAACAEDGVTDASRQELCRAARQIDGAVVTSCYLVSRLLSLTARCF